MQPHLQDVLNFAVWCSLSATLVLGVFSVVQAFVDPPRRARYLLFGLVMGYLAGLDISRSALHLDPMQYEWLRIWWAGLYAGSLLSLLGYSYRAAVSVSSALLLLGLVTYHAVNKAQATTIMFPWSFGVTSLAFARRAWTERGYASSCQRRRTWARARSSSSNSNGLDRAAAKPISAMRVCSLLPT